MEDSPGEIHKQERALRAIQVFVVSGFLEDNRRLMESCLVICNSCRECVPLQYLRVDGQAPPTLLAMFRPELLCTEAEGASRVLAPRRVLEVRWTFQDPAREEEEAEEKEDGKEGEGEKEEEQRLSLIHI